MKNILKNFATISDIYSAVIGEREIETSLPLAEVANKRFCDIREVYDFLEERDVLTDALYGAPDEEGRITFPFAVKKVKEGVKPYVGKLGDQTSPKHHLETIKQHAAMVVYNLVPSVGLDLACLLGVLHDCAKKYTCGTNTRGEACFYGHDRLSAYLGGKWAYDSFGVSGDELKTLVAVIYAHILPKMVWPQKPDKETEFYLTQVEPLFGLPSGYTRRTERVEFKISNLIEALSDCDEGCRTEDDLKRVSSKIIIGESLMSAHSMMQGNVFRTKALLAS